MYCPRTEHCSWVNQSMTGVVYHNFFITCCWGLKKRPCWLKQPYPNKNVQTLQKNYHLFSFLYIFWIHIQLHPNPCFNEQCYWEIIIVCIFKSRLPRLTALQMDQKVEWYQDDWYTPGQFDTTSRCSGYSAGFVLSSQYSDVCALRMLGMEHLKQS